MGPLMQSISYSYRESGSETVITIPAENGCSVNSTADDDKFGNFFKHFSIFL